MKTARKHYSTMPPDAYGIELNYEYIRVIFTSNQP